MLSYLLRYKLYLRKGAKLDVQEKTKGGTINKLYIKILEALDGNAAETASVRGKVRIADGTYPSDYDGDLTDFDLTPDTDPNSKGQEIVLDDAKLSRIEDLLFPPDGDINNIDIMLDVEQCARQSPHAAHVGFDVIMDLSRLHQISITITPRSDSSLGTSS